MIIMTADGERTFKPFVSSTPRACIDLELDWLNQRNRSIQIWNDFIAWIDANNRNPERHKTKPYLEAPFWCRRT